MYTIVDFQIRLNCEIWDSVEGDDVNKIFNFFSVYLIIFISSFPFTTVKSLTADISWITPGINISCKCKTELYIASRNSNNSAIKNITKIIIKYCQSYKGSKEIKL
jgi:hypothetical protein